MGGTSDREILVAFEIFPASVGLLVAVTGVVASFLPVMHGVSPVKSTTGIVDSWNEEKCTGGGDA